MLRATEASQWEVARPIADIQLPRSVQGLIAARLDGLPDDEKAVLQDAAVVGRVFWVGALAELTGRPIAEVRDALGRLRVKELVVPHEPSSFRDEQEFAFRHGLIRDGAYDSLPKALRADKHLGVARWAADRAGDRAEEIAELIATHEIEALRYLDELGERRPEVDRAGVRTRVGCRPSHVGAEPGRREHPLVPRSRAARRSAGDPAGGARAAGPRARGRNRGAGTAWPRANGSLVAPSTSSARSGMTAGSAGRTPGSSSR